MIIDKIGLPRDNGASDKQDSARLAGVAAIIGMFPKFALNLYVLHIGKYVRHPQESKYSFSRDQSICLFAGLNSQKLSILVDPNYKTEGDIVSPSVRGHFRRCAGLEASWFQDAWLWLDVLFNCHVKPLTEPNQLVCMMLVHPDKKYLKYWTSKNKQWQDSINEYWNGWRDEPTVSAAMINKIKSLI